MIAAAIITGILLAWFQIEGLRRDVRKLINAGQQGRKWPTVFLFRWSAVALAVWFFLHLFKQNILPFIISFIVSGFLLRIVYKVLGTDSFGVCRQRNL